MTSTQFVLARLLTPVEANESSWALPAALDWALLAAQAEAHELGPLLYDRLRQRPWVQPPAPILTQLQRQYATVGLVNACLLRSLAELLDCLERAAIPTLVLKGAALGPAVYGNLAVRPMRDLDLFVPWSHAARAYALLTRLGYRALEERPFADDSGLVWHSHTWQRPGSPPVVLELHWALLDIPLYHRYWPFPPLWARAWPLEIEGVLTRMLAPEDQLLHLCAHSLYHHQGEGVWAALDIAQVVSVYRSCINWDELLTQAEQCGLGLALRQGLRLAAEQWLAPIPDAVLARLSRLRVRRWEAWLAHAQGSEFLKLGRTWLTLPTWALRWRFIWRQIFPQRPYMVWRYGIAPDAALGPAYVRRWGWGGRRLKAELAPRYR